MHMCVGARARSRYLDLKTCLPGRLGRCKSFLLCQNSTIKILRCNHTTIVLKGNHRQETIIGERFQV